MDDVVWFVFMDELGFAASISAPPGVILNRAALPKSRGYTYPKHGRSHRRYHPSYPCYEPRHCYTQPLAKWRSTTFGDSNNSCGSSLPPYLTIQSILTTLTERNGELPESMQEHHRPSHQPKPEESRQNAPYIRSKSLSTPPAEQEWLAYSADDE